jgi:septum formation protein
MDLLKDRKILLASQSPRRRQLLEEAGYKQFRILPADIDETFPDEMPLEQAAEFVAKNKALAIRHLAQADEVILSADSMVILDGVHFAKPATLAEAKEMLAALAGNSHTVITGVCLANHQKMVTFSGITTVTMHPMTAQEIDYYVEQYKPLDKAGAYGVQEWIGLCKIAHIQGTYANVMGLPTDLVYARLLEF